MQRHSDSIFHSAKSPNAEVLSGSPTNSKTSDLQRVRFNRYSNGDKGHLLLSTAHRDS